MTVTAAGTVMSACSSLDAVTTAVSEKSWRSSIVRF
jgi:hypothetical protein